MKSNKLLMIGVLGLAFGVVSQVEAFKFGLKNDSTFNYINFKLRCTNPRLPKSLGNLELLVENVNRGQVFEKQVSCGAKEVYLDIAYPLGFKHAMVTYRIDKGTGLSEKDIILEFKGTTLKAVGGQGEVPTIKLISQPIEID